MLVIRHNFPESSILWVEHPQSGDEIVSTLGWKELKVTPNTPIGHYSPRGAIGTKGDVKTSCHKKGWETVVCALLGKFSGITPDGADLNSAKEFFSKKPQEPKCERLLECKKAKFSNLPAPVKAKRLAEIPALESAYAVEVDLWKQSLLEWGKEVLSLVNP